MHPPPPAPSDRYAAPTFARRFVVIDCRHDPCGGRRPRLRRSPAAGVSALPCGPSHGRRSRRSASRYRPVPTKRSRPRADQVWRGEAGSHSPDVPVGVDRSVAARARVTSSGERKAGGVDWRYLQTLGTEEERSTGIWPERKRKRQNERSAVARSRTYSADRLRVCAMTKSRIESAFSDCGKPLSASLDARKVRTSGK